MFIEAMTTKVLSFSVEDYKVMDHSEEIIAAAGLFRTVPRLDPDNRSGIQDILKDYKVEKKYTVYT